MSAFAPPQRQNQSGHLVSPAAGQHAVCLFPQADNSSDLEPSLGNQAMQRLLQARVIQAKLTVSQPGDEYEQEADRIADQVMRMTDPGLPGKVKSHDPVQPIRVQHLCPSCDEELHRQPIEAKKEEEDEERRKLLQRKENAAGVPEITPEVESTIEGLKVGGRPLNGDECELFEARVGYDMSSVRIHTGRNADQSARQLQSRAYTIGRHIVFADGELTLDSISGKKLLVHELVHVLQQTSPKTNTLTTSASTLSSKSHNYQKESSKRQGLRTDLCRTTPLSFGKTAEQYTVLLQGAPTVQRQSNVPSKPPEEQKPESRGVQPGDTEQKGFKPPPQPKGELVEHDLSGVYFSDSPEYVRYQLEMWVAKEGPNRLAVFSTGNFRIVPSAGGIPIPLAPPYTVALPPSEWGAYLARVESLVKGEIEILTEQINDFKTHFQFWASSIAFEVTEKSRKSIEAERERLGIKVGTKTSMAASREEEELVTAARLLLSRQEGVLAAQEEYNKASHELLHKGTTGGPPSPELWGERDAKQYLEEAVEEFNLARGSAEADHPILASFQLEAGEDRTTGILASLVSSSSESRAEMVATEIEDRLKNIEKTQEYIREKPSRIWRVPRVVAATKAGGVMKTVPGLSDAIKEAVVSQSVTDVEIEKEQLDMILMALQVGVALILLAPSGGMSAPVMTGVRAGALALDVLQAKEAIEEYEFQEAASGTDFDKAKAISSEEPSLLWLALNILPVAASFGDALSSFRKLLTQSNNVKFLRAAGEAEEAARQVEELKLLAAEKKVPDAGDRLAKELEEEAVGSLSGALKTEGALLEFEAPGGHVYKATPFGLAKCSNGCTLLSMWYTEELAGGPWYIRARMNTVDNLARQAHAAKIAGETERAWELGEAAQDLARAVEEELAPLVRAKVLTGTLQKLCDVWGVSLQTVETALLEVEQNLIKAGLDPDAVARVLSKVPKAPSAKTFEGQIETLIQHMRGQVVEERVLEMAHGARRSFRETFGNDPWKGHYPIRNLMKGGKQIADVVIGKVDWDALTITIIRVIEVKAGKASAKGLAKQVPQTLDRLAGGAKVTIGQSAETFTVNLVTVTVDVEAVTPKGVLAGRLSGFPPGFQASEIELTEAELGQLFEPLENLKKLPASKKATTAKQTAAK